MRVFIFLFSLLLAAEVLADDLSICDRPADGTLVLSSNAVMNLQAVMSHAQADMLSDPEQANWFPVLEPYVAPQLHADLYSPANICSSDVLKIFRDSVCGRARIKAGQFNSEKWHLVFGLEFVTPDSRDQSQKAFIIDVPGGYMELMRGF